MSGAEDRVRAFLGAYRRLPHNNPINYISWASVAEGQFNLTEADLEELLTRCDRAGSTTCPEDGHPVGVDS
jgi:hypothetical protein